MIFYYDPVLGLKYDFELPKKVIVKKDIITKGSKFFKSRLNK